MQFCCNDDATLRSILAKITVLASSPHAARMHILSFLTLLLPLAAASSTRPTPLHPRALSHPSAQSHRILTRTPSAAASLVSRSLDGELTDAAEPTQGKAVEWNHHWILRFTAHDKPLLFALRPSENVIHPDGVKLTETHVDPTTGRETTSIRVFKREEARIYTGWVIEPEEEEDWVRGELAAVERSHDDGRGYARITLLDDGIATDDGVDHELRWQGSYSLDNQLYTVHSTPTFLRTKETLDPEPPLLLKKRSSDSTPPTYDYPSMVIVREGDELTRDQQLAALKKRGLDVTTLPPPTVLGCGHDDLPFNSNLSHPVFTNQIDDRDITWTSPAMNLFGLTSRSATSYPPSLLHKRQADISGGMGRSSNFINSIGSKVGCPAQQTVVFIGVAADCTYTTRQSTILFPFLREADDTKQNTERPTWLELKSSPTSTKFPPSTPATSTSPSELSNWTSAPVHVHLPPIPPPPGMSAVPVSPSTIDSAPSPPGEERKQPTALGCGIFSRIARRGVRSVLRGWERCVRRGRRRMRVRRRVGPLLLLLRGRRL